MATRERARGSKRAAADKRPPAARRKSPGRAPPKHRRYAVVYDIEGPRVRLGLLWFLVSAAALLAGPLVAGVLYSATAAAAGLQAAQAWRRKGIVLDRRVVAIGAGVLPLAAAVHTAALAVALLVLAGLAYYVALVTGPQTRPTLVDAGYIMQCSLLPGLAGAGMVLTVRYSTWAALALLLLVSAYESGDYLVGSGSRNRFDGPIAGIVAVAVFTFAVGTPGIRPLDFPSVIAFGAGVAVLAPLGQLLASAILPAADAPAPALRRIDSLLLLAPLWAWAVGWWNLTNLPWGGQAPLTTSPRRRCVAASWGRAGQAGPAALTFTSGRTWRWRACSRRLAS